jgi:transcriptional regulator with XRE-family HTH domain
MSGLSARFGQTIRQLRETNGWSQELLAERANLNRSYLGEIERGAAIPSIATAAKVALAFDISLSSLFRRCERVETV